MDVRTGGLCVRRAGQVGDCISKNDEWSDMGRKNAASLFPQCRLGYM